MAFLDALTGGAANTAYKNNMQTINTGLTQQSTALGDNYTQANNYLLGQGLDALLQGYNTGRTNLGTGYQDSRTDLNAGYMSGQDALNANYGKALGSLGQGRDDLTSNYAAGRDALTSNYGQARSDLGTQYGQTQGYLGQATASYAPMVQGGQSAFNNYLNATGANGAAGSAAAAANFTASPGYQYSTDQALGAVQRSAAARGGLAGGNATSDILNTANGLANQQFQQYTANRTGGGEYVARLNTTRAYLNRLGGAGDQPAAAPTQVASADPSFAPQMPGRGGALARQIPQGGPPQAPGGGDDVDAYLTASGLPVNAATRGAISLLGPQAGRRFVSNTLANPQAPSISNLDDGVAQAHPELFLNPDGSPKLSGQAFGLIGRQHAQGGPRQPVADASAALPPGASGLNPGRPVQFANNEADTQRLEAQMGMMPAQRPANPQADMPVPNAQPAEFQIPPGPQQGMPGAVASLPPGFGPQSGGALQGQRAFPPSSDNDAMNGPARTAPALPRQGIPLSGNPGQFGGTQPLPAGVPSQGAAMQRARGLFRDYKQAFAPRFTGDAAGNNLRRILERDASPNEVAGMLFGSPGSGRVTSGQMQTLSRLRDAVGADSPAWQAVQSALVTRHLGGETRDLGGRLDYLLSADGRGLMPFLSGQQQQGLRALKGATRQLEAAREPMPDWISGLERTGFDPNAVGRSIFGGSGAIGAKPGAALEARAARGLLGPDSAEWAGVRQAAVHRLLDASTPAVKMAAGLRDFTDGSGKGVASALFSPEELGNFRRLSGALQATVRPDGTIRPGAAGEAGQKAVAKLVDLIAGAIAFKVGGLGAAAGTYGAKIGTRAIMGGVGAASARRAFEGGAPRLVLPPPGYAVSAGSATGRALETLGAGY